MGIVRLEYAAPSSDLAEYVAAFYDFEIDGDVFEDAERAGHAQLRFWLRPASAHYTFPRGAVEEAAPVHIKGPTWGAVNIRIQGPAHLVGLGLTPAGWAAVIGRDACDFADRTADAAYLLPRRELEETHAALRACDGHAARIATMEAYIRRFVHAASGEALAFMRLVDQWLSDDPSPQMASVIAASGLSRRQVERKCKTLYGAPPKLLARKYRALRAAVALATGQEAIDEILARGFYDQSHLIREVKQFTGVTPRQIATRPTLLARETMAHRGRLAGRVHPITSHT